MTRRFRDEWEASRPDSSPDDDAPQSVQDDVTALLRRSVEADADVRMPDHVAARMRATLQAEFGAGSRRDAGAPSDVRADDAARGSSEAGAFDGAGAPQRDAPQQVTPAAPEAAPAPSTIVPLPTRRDAAAPARPSVESSSQVDRPAAQREVPHQAPHDHGTAHHDTAQHDTTHHDTTHHGAPAGVTSLADRRERRRSRLTKGAIALGAAAAVGIGAVTISQSLGHHDDGPVAARSAASGDAGATNYASRVRVTQTETPYTSRRLVTQAASLPTSKSAPIEPVQANAQSLGPLATEEGIHSCLDALGSTMAQNPDKVYADFATYDGSPAVVVVTVKDGKKTAWVVSRTCTKASDLKAGPASITT